MLHILYSLPPSQSTPFYHDFNFTYDFWDIEAWNFPKLLNFVDVETDSQAGKGNRLGLYNNYKDSREIQNPDLRIRDLFSHHASSLSTMPLSSAGITQTWSFDLSFGPVHLDGANHH